MAQAQTGPTLFQDLKAIGVNLPDDMTSAEIRLGFRQPVYIIARTLDWATGRMQKHGFTLTDEDGQTLMSDEFCRLAKEPMGLPEEITSFSIKVVINEIATTYIECATPKGILDFLKGYKAASEMKKDAAPFEATP